MSDVSPAEAEASDQAADHYPALALYERKGNLVMDERAHSATLAAAPQTK
jgi:hypothetical protein